MIKKRFLSMLVLLAAVVTGAMAQTTYKVSLKEGTEDASNWQGKAGSGEYQALPLEGVAAGTAVTVKYNGTKKVKSVKAKKKAAAAPAATVTTAPTAKTGVKAGQNEAIVNAGTAEGGTMMYAVTTDATQPASTDGFSATVPTAEGLTAGTYYVWYYVKADDSHIDSEISATGIEVTIEAAGPPAATGHALSVSAVGEVVGTDGKAYAAADKGNLPTGVTAAGMVAYKNGSNGLVIALADEANTMNWSTATGASGAAAHTPVVTGGTWKLPSKAEWNQMFGDDADANPANYMSLNYALAAAGGTALPESYSYYWSSTEIEDGIAYVELDCGSANWRNDGDEYEDHLVRACLAF